MYIKINNGQVEKYPYSYSQLIADNSNVSFPATPTDELLAEWGVYPVSKSTKPEFLPYQDITEETPELIDGVWTQVWNVTFKSQVEIDAINEQLRLEAYRNESDPLFFKWQRGEIEKQVWLDKVAEIKTRYS